MKNKELFESIGKHKQIFAIGFDLTDLEDGTQDAEIRSYIAETKPETKPEPKSDDASLEKIAKTLGSINALLAITKALKED